MRFPILDGFRGFFILFMMIMHLNGPLDSMLGRINHHYFGWVEDAQGFIFISGIVVGLVYGGILIKYAAPAMVAAVWRRIWTIYKHQAFLIFLFLSVGVLLVANGMNPGFSQNYVKEPFYFTAFSLLLMTGSVHMGILPMYIFFLAATPLLLRLMQRGYFAPIAVGSASLWLVAQSGLIDLVVLSAENHASDMGRQLKFGIFFNVLGWQVIYVAGLVCGWLLVNGRLDLTFLRARQYGSACLIALFAVFCLGLFDRVIFWNLISEEYSNAFLAREQRGDFSPIYLVAFALDLYVVTWLLVAGPFSRWAPVRFAADLTQRLFTHPALVMLGRHSLTLFAYHLVVVYAVRLVVGAGPVSQLEGAAIMVVATASLFPVALLAERHRRRAPALAVSK